MIGELSEPIQTVGSMVFVCLSCGDEEEVIPMNGDKLPFEKNCSSCGTSVGRARKCAECHELVSTWKYSKCTTHRTEADILTVPYKCRQCGTMSTNETNGDVSLSCDCASNVKQLCLTCQNNAVRDNQLVCVSCQSLFGSPVSNQTD